MLLTCTLNDSTRGLVDGPFLAAMRPGALLVNVARGGLLDYDSVARVRIHFYYTRTRTRSSARPLAGIGERAAGRAGHGRGLDGALGSQRLRGAASALHHDPTRGRRHGRLLQSHGGGDGGGGEATPGGPSTQRRGQHLRPVSRRRPGQTARLLTYYALLVRVSWLCARASARCCAMPRRAASKALMPSAVNSVL